MKTISDIANEFTMKRFKTASQPDGHSDKEYYDLLGVYNPPHSNIKRN